MNAYSGPRADLHLHTDFSDGFFSPEEIVRMAHENGVSAISVSDHDNIDGIARARRAGERNGITVLSGVELSSQWEGFRDIHILGYGFDPEAADLKAELADFRNFREGRNEMIVERVNKALAAEGRTLLDFNEVREFAEGTIGRPHIARALIEAGHVRDNEEAFQRYLVRCNVEKRFFPADQAINLIHRSGGVAVLAHPPFITSDRPALEKLFDTLASLGIDGLEVYNNATAQDDVDYLTTQARKRNLIATGGSDFHGFSDSEACIGMARGTIPIPYACYEEVQRALDR